MISPTIFTLGRIDDPAARWKSLTEGFATAKATSNPATLFQSKAAVSDTVSISAAARALSGIEETSPPQSELRRSLKGVAADLYDHLDEKTQARFDGFVESAKISTGEMGKALQAMASNAVANRVFIERPKDDEDKANAKLSAQLHDQFFEEMRVYGGLRDGMRAVGAAHERGEITVEELGEGLSREYGNIREGIEKYKQEQIAKFGKEPGELRNDILQTTFKKNIDAYNNAAPDGSEFGFLKFGDPSTRDATEKLSTLMIEDMRRGGPNAPKNARELDDLLGRYAADVDIPGYGKGTYTPSYIIG